MKNLSSGEEIGWKMASEEIDIVSLQVFMDIMDVKVKEKQKI